MTADWTTETIPEPWVHQGMLCAIKRVSHSGHLCGYVRVPPGHPLHNIGYSAEVPEALTLAVEAMKNGEIGKRGIIDVFCFALGGEMHAGMLFDVHGGITFSGDCTGEKGYLPDGFWYGFDCAHSGDLCPATAQRYPGLYSDRDGETYRDVPYLKAECESLATQLAQLQNLVA